MSEVEVIEMDERDGEFTYTQGNPPLLIRIRWWLIRKIARDMPVFLNLEVVPHTKAECSRAYRVMNCYAGLFSGSIKARHGCGITMKQVTWSKP